MLSMLGTRKRNHFKFTLLQQHLEFTELISIKSNELSNRNANSHLTPNLSVCLCKVIGLFDPGKDTIHYNNLLSLLNDTQWKLQPPSIILSLSFSVHLIFSDWFDLAVWPLSASSCLFEEIPICLVAKTRCQTQTALPEESLRQTRAGKSNGISNSQALNISQACWEFPPPLCRKTSERNVHYRSKCGIIETFLLF